MNSEIIAKREFVHHRTVKYSIFVSSFTVIMTFGNVPTWVIFLSLFILIGKFLGGKRYIPKIIYPVFTILSTVFILYDFRTLFDIEAGISLLILLQAIKFLEAFKKRDYFVHFNILIFVIAGQVIFAQSIISTITAIITLLLILYGMVALESQYVKINYLKSISFESATLYLIILTCITISLYLFFPRYEAGFARMYTSITRSGFSPDLKPNIVDKVVLSDEVIFRVKFLNDIRPSLKDLYWIGSVLWHTDGYSWDPGTYFFEVEKPFIKGNNLVKYEISSETLINSYLFSLDHPSNYPQINLAIKMVRDKTFQLAKISTKKIHYQQSSYIDPTLKKHISDNVRTLALRLPRRKRLSKLVNFAKKFKGKNDQETISNVLNFFTKEKFEYTLNPGTTKNLMEFLTETKKGFCGHYASALAVLARLLNIPARVIVGFQGGKYNEYGKYFIIKGKDAHAWTEIFYKNKGWTRIDPVQYIRPSRVELGGQDFFDTETFLSSGFLGDWGKIYIFDRLKSLGLFWDTINTKWGQFIYSFDTTFQKRMAERFNIDLRKLYTLIFWIPISLLFLLFFLQSRISKKKIAVDHVLKYYQKLIDFMKKKGMDKPAFEGPFDYSKRLSIRFSKNKKYLDDFFQHYIELRYIEDSQDRTKEKKLKESLRQILNTSWE